MYTHTVYHVSFVPDVSLQACPVKQICSNMTTFKERSASLSITDTVHNKTNTKVCSVCALTIKE